MGSFLRKKVVQEIVKFLTKIIISENPAKEKTKSSEN